jgi:hypothetical protein
MGRPDVFSFGGARESRDVAVGARERMPVGPEHVLSGGGRITPRGAEVGARERLPAGSRYVRCIG